MSAASKGFFGLTVAASVVAGCAALIDLGDEPKLLVQDAAVESSAVTPVDSGAHDAEAGAVPDGGTPDADAGPVNVCGLPDSNNKSCASCIHASECCAISTACANTPNCVKGLDCVKHCVVDLGCISQCRIDFPEVIDLTDCSARNCGDCTPQTECRRLGQCVFGLPSDNIIRISMEALILDVDEDKCLKARTNIVENGDSDAGQCFFGIDAGSNP